MEPTAADELGVPNATIQADAGTGLPGSASSRFERVVAVLREFWYVDRTSTITGIAVACRLRERLPDFVPLKRGEKPEAPSVIVDGSVGVFVADDADRRSALRRLARAAESVTKLVVYEPRPEAASIGALPAVRDRLADLGVAEISFVSGGASVTTGTGAPASTTEYSRSGTDRRA